MFTNLGPILERIQADLVAVVSGVNISIDEPIDIIYEDLPTIAIYPVREDFIYDDSYNGSSKKRLLVRIELRMTGGPASVICSPVINTIATAIQNDGLLNRSLASYVELQSVQWANEQVSSGQICGASLDVQIDYFV